MVRATAPHSECVQGTEKEAKRDAGQAEMTEGEPVVCESAEQADKFLAQVQVCLVESMIRDRIVRESAAGIGEISEEEMYWEAEERSMEDEEREGEGMDVDATGGTGEGGLPPGREVVMKGNAISGEEILAAMGMAPHCRALVEVPEGRRGAGGDGERGGCVGVVEGRGRTAEVKVRVPRG